MLILTFPPKCETTFQEDIFSPWSVGTFLSIWILIVILWDLKLKATLVNVYQAVVKTDCWHPATSCILSPIYCCVDLRVTAESRRSVMTALYVLEITILLCVKKYILNCCIGYYIISCLWKEMLCIITKNKCNIISNLLILYWYFVFVQLMILIIISKNRS